MTDETDDSGRDRSADAQYTHEAAVLIADHQGEILNLWVDAVIENISAAQNQSRAELGNHLQNLLDDIVNALNSVGEDFSPRKISELEGFGLPSALHGRERASIQGYTVTQVVHEYVVLRHVLTTFCANHNLGDVRTIDVVSHVIEYASLSAVQEFVYATEEVQRKLLSTLIHDVRTPLGIASNYAQLLSMADLSAERRGDAIQTIGKSVARAGDMIEELLNMASLDAGRGLFMRFEEADINDALTTVCKEADQLYRGTPIKGRLEDHPVTGVFDMALIIRTVENLISNAVKFGDKESPVDVILEDQGDSVSVRVHNHGNPIPQDDVERIFNFFSTSGDNGNDDGVKSWGLGLSLIKTVANSHGGEVMLDSSAEGGTTFGMTLRKHYAKSGTERTVLI